MRSRQEIKSIGKQRFLENYWPCVAAPILVQIVSAIITAGVTFIAVRTGQEELGTLPAIAIDLLVMGPLSIGVCYFFVQVIFGHQDEILVDTPFRTALTGYGRKLGGVVWMYLFQFLWTLLFLIPGIIKYFAYAMTPFILGDCPNVKAKDALKLSMRIMKGRKADLFVFYLSYIGWAILSALTFGLLAIFYVQPYMYSSLACFYLEAREDALRRGVITLAQLQGQEPV